MPRLRKLTYSEVLLALNRKQVIDKEDVHGKVFERLIWSITIQYQDGHMFLLHYERTKINAVEYVIRMIGNEASRGIETALIVSNTFRYKLHPHGMISVTIVKRKVHELL